MLNLYGLSAYDKKDSLINETGYNIPFKWMATLFAKMYKKSTKASVVEIHLGTRQGGFYKIVGQV